MAWLERRFRHAGDRATVPGGRLGWWEYHPVMAVLACFPCLGRCGDNELQDVGRGPGGMSVVWMRLGLRVRWRAWLGADGWSGSAGAAQDGRAVLRGQVMTGFQQAGQQLRFGGEGAE
jgi:hypothetical protein